MQPLQCAEKKEDAVRASIPIDPSNSEASTLLWKKKKRVPFSSEADPVVRHSFRQPSLASGTIRYESGRVSLISPHSPR